MSTLKSIPVIQIRENPKALRSVNRESEEYLGLVDSMRVRGFFGAITVCASKHPETGEKDFILVDGLHRLTAARDAGIEQINVDVVKFDDENALLAAQIMMNIHKIDTKPIEYTNQLKRILMNDPLLTSAQLSSDLGKSPQWLDNRLSLTKITNETIKALIDEGKISLSNAYSLAKLPESEHADWVDRAQTLSPEEFAPEIKNRTKEINAAKRKGDGAPPAEFVATPHFRKLKDVRAEMDTGEVGSAIAAELSGAEAFALGVQWCTNMDPAAVAAAKSKDEERKAAIAEKAAERRAATAAAKVAKADAEALAAAAEAKAADEAKAALANA